MPNKVMDREQLIQEVQSAFNGVTLGDGVGIYEAEALDDFASEKVVMAAREKDRSNWAAWQEIPNNIIEKHYSVLCFVDAEGMRYLLPAYMVFSLENYDKSDSASIDSTFYALDIAKGSDEQFEAIHSNQQKSIIAQFLKYMVLEAGEQWVDVNVASRAYESFWAKYETQA